jgi:acyl-CoA synthetase (AMP-forming)/AMP-acid ligase II
MELSYVHASRGDDFRLRGVTTGQWLRETVDRYGANDALVSPSQRYRGTCTELWEQTGAVAKALLANGVQLREHCVGRIATHKIPVHWSFVRDCPVTASGKVRKFVLRDLWVEQQDQVSSR